MGRGRCDKDRAWCRMNVEEPGVRGYRGVGWSRGSSPRRPALPRRGARARGAAGAGGAPGGGGGGGGVRVRPSLVPLNPCGMGGGVRVRPPLDLCCMGGEGVPMRAGPSSPVDSLHFAPPRAGMVPCAAAAPCGRGASGVLGIRPPRSRVRLLEQMRSGAQMTLKYSCKEGPTLLRPFCGWVKEGPTLSRPSPPQ